MPFAWPTVVILFLLLPGFLFFVGITSAESFTRQIAQRTVIGQLAGLLTVAIVVHGVLLFVAVIGATVGVWPRVSWSVMFSALAPGSATAVENLTVNISPYWLLIPVYFVAANIFGFCLGRLLVRGAAKDWWILGGFARSRWLYDLQFGDNGGGRAIPFAHVVTRMSAQGRVVMYRGSLYDGTVDRRGRLVNLVLSRAERTYFRLGATEAGIEHDNWHRLGSSEESSVRSSAEDLFVIWGEEIQNAAFTRAPWSEPAAGTEDAIEEAVKRIEEVRSQLRDLY